ncbi:MAG TPA: hypothetical protein VKK31_15465 [Thermoanaerobaculia bacterium]|nr:hypothetical protein [Thermoanaerobaculia bacterium]
MDRIAGEPGGQKVGHRLDAEHALVQAVQGKEKILAAGRPLLELGAVKQILNEEGVAAVVFQVEIQNLRGSRSGGPLPVHLLELGTLADARLPEQHGTTATRDGLKWESIGIEIRPVLARRIGKEALVIQDQMTVSGYPEAWPAEVGECKGHM